MKIIRNEAERNALALEWKGLVPYVLRRLSHRTAVRRNLVECRAEGYLGLLRAAATWDETRGIQFYTLGVVCVRRSILAEAYRCHRQIPALFSDLVPADEDDRAFDPAAPEVHTPDLDRARLAAALANLPERERALVMAIFGLDGSAPRSATAVGLELGVTHQRVSQIVALALDRLRRELERGPGPGVFAAALRGRGTTPSTPGTGPADPSP